MRLLTSHVVTEVALAETDTKVEVLPAKQIIAVRKDLNMRKGKLAAQVAHASMKVYFDRMTEGPTDRTFKDDMEIEYFKTYRCDFTPRMVEWMNGLFTKIVVSVNSEAEILELEKKAKEANVPCAVITDAGLTEFHGVPTITCIAIGPDDPNEIDKITKDLPLL